MSVNVAGTFVPELISVLSCVPPLGMQGGLDG